MEILIDTNVPKDFFVDFALLNCRKRNVGHPWENLRINLSNISIDKIILLYKQFEIHTKYHRFYYVLAHRSYLSDWSYQREHLQEPVGTKEKKIDIECFVWWQSFTWTGSGNFVTNNKRYFVTINSPRTIPFFPSGENVISKHEC